MGRVPHTYQRTRKWVAHVAPCGSWPHISRCRKSSIKTVTTVPKPVTYEDSTVLGVPRQVPRPLRASFVDCDFVPQARNPHDVLWGD